MTLSIEVLPAPFGPMMARISPLRMSNETSLIALTPPNASDTFSTESSTSPAAMSCPLGALMQQPCRRGAAAARAEGTGSLRVHAAFSMAAATGTVATSRILTRADSTPLRPSSNVTSVEMSASLAPP